MVIAFVLVFHLITPITFPVFLHLFLVIVFTASYLCCAFQVIRDPLVFCVILGFVSMKVSLFLMPSHQFCINSRMPSQGLQSRTYLSVNERKWLLCNLGAGATATELKKD